MIQHPILIDLAKKLIESTDRYKAHREVKQTIEHLCQDKVFLHEVIKGYLSNKDVLWSANSLSIPLYYSGDVLIQINLFCPIRDGGKDICHDNIHHHGWRLLSTGVVTGKGYDAINFVHNSHNKKDGEKVHIEVEEIFKHVPGEVRFVDSNTAHVVFHTDSLCSTLAVWSADHKIVSQNIKRFLTNFPNLRKRLVRIIHTLRLNKALGLNPLKGLYYHPEGGKIVETQNYNKPFDGSREEILGCWFKFFQQIELIDNSFWENIIEDAPPEAVSLIKMITTGVSIPDNGIWGNLRRRFSKTQILQAIDNSVPPD